MSIDAASLAFIEVISAHSVGLVNTKLTRIGPKEQKEAIGTATAVRRNGRYFLLTAKHNVEDSAPADFQFMPKGLGATIFEPLPIDKYAVLFRQDFPIADIICCPWEDLALLLLKDTSEQSGNFMEYLDWKEDVRSPAPGEMVTALGHPASKAYLVADRWLGDKEIQRELGVSKAVMSCRVLPNERGKYIRDFDPERQFLVDCADILDLYEPHGFSGCGWWMHKESDGHVWTASPMFSGVEVKFARRPKLLVSVRPEVVSSWLAEISA